MQSAAIKQPLTQSFPKIVNFVGCSLKTALFLYGMGNQWSLSRNLHEINFHAHETTKFHENALE